MRIDAECEDGGRPGGSTATPVQLTDAAAALLVDAGSVMARSLDLGTTMREVARLTVPRIASLCVIDLRDADGSIRDVAVAAVDESVARSLEDLRARHPLDPAGEHPVARVIRTGEPELRASMTSAALSSFAQGDEHARFMIEHDYRSAVIAPLLARGRTLGALSVLRLGAGPPYGGDDLDLVCELARRAALALDNARLFSELQSLERRLEAILANVAEAITVIDADGQTVFANQAAADLLDAQTSSDLIQAPQGEVMKRFLVLDEDGRELDLDEMPARRLLRGEPAEPQLVRNVIRATGEERWLVVRATPITDPETGRLNYVINVYENITDVKRAQLAESFLAQASDLLATSMDYAETLAGVARLAVPQIADWCAVDLLDEDGRVERVAIHHTDPAKLALAERLHRLYRPASDEPTGVAEVIRSGRPVIVTDIPPAALAAYARDAGHLEILEAIGMTAVVIVPMPGAVGTIGAITLVSSESSRRLSPADLAVAVRLARRIGTAIENARVYTERTRIADTLQRALLPESLPEIPGVDVAALYSAAGELNEVGGDFYDVFEYGGGRWMLVIGDVCGKGPRAAGVTALARHTLRAAAQADQSPERMLDTLHRALRRQPAGADLCTACLVVFEPGPAGGSLTVALAGHERPLIISRDGEARPIGSPGTLLGVIDPIVITTTEADLLPGETLLLFTDGVPDAGRPTPLGEAGLFEVCARASALPLAALLSEIERAASDHAHGRLRDDIALLALRPDPVAVTELEASAC
ncbi:MAG TPA: SpoIIE family protein phosphatase [Solirubrobacteraceae bacterium]|jgi:PAS domain S-box-containing protein|nr:SpoIIE family protein phosphatase [Solirubrobacteraceae bacterium]